MNLLLNFFRSLRRYYLQNKLSENSNIKLYNYIIYSNINYIADSNVSVENHWLYEFISAKFSNKLNGKTLSLFGVNGSKLAFKINKSNYKIFFTYENVHVKLSPWYKYRDLLIDNKMINLSLGFDYLNHPKYLRFPYWLVSMFNSYDNFSDIQAKCYEIDNQSFKIENRNKFCCFICRFDYFGDRSYFADQVETVDKIYYPGVFRQNDPDLKVIYGDNKIEYLKQFKFNLCPENSNNSGYVTEKIFDAVKAGCIPIYWGSKNSAEPDILNQNRIIYLELNNDNNEALQKIKYLNENPIEYIKFIKQPIFNENAPEIIYKFFTDLENSFKKIIQ